jgi:hypothetical protein
LLVLIDESGDPGFKLDKGSTQHFVIAMVIFEDYSQAEACSAAIAAERTRLNIKPEFKFNKTSANSKDAFFEAIRPFKFCILALVIDKEKIRSPIYAVMTSASITISFRIYYAMTAAH